MAHEEKIKADLIAKFPALADKTEVKRERRIWTEVASGDPGEFHKVVDFIYQSLGFSILCTITGLDTGETLTFVYHFARPDGVVLNVKAIVPKNNPVHRSIHRIFPSAVLYERELVDLLGAKVSDLPEGQRYPLPDDWPAGQYPLRKDWKPEMLKTGNAADPVPTKG